MKCPMFETAMGTNGKIVPIEFLTRERECLKEECASWDEDLECCGEVSKRISLNLIAELLGELVNKIPTHWPIH